MSNIALSQKEITLVNYKLAFIRSRKFEIKNEEMQNFIRKTFHDAILLNHADKKTEFIKTIQRSLFPLEDEEKAGEKINPKESDFFLLTMFFETLIEHNKNGLKVETGVRDFFVRYAPIEILLRGYCELIENKICRNYFFKTQNVSNPTNFIDAIINIMNELKEIFPEKKQKTWVNKTLKTLKEFTKKALEQKEKEKQITTEQKEEVKTTNQIVKVEKEKKKEKKAFSKMSTSELSELTESIVNNEHDLEEDEIASFVAYILKSESRITRHLRGEKRLEVFYDIAFKKDLEFVFPITLNTSEKTKLGLVEFLTKKTPEREADLYLLFESFDKEKADELSLAEKFLKVYKKNSYEHVETVFLKEEKTIEDLKYPHQENNFLFFEEGKKDDEDILQILLISQQFRDSKVIYNKEKFYFRSDKYDFSSYKKTNEILITPIIAASWDFYEYTMFRIYNLIINNLNDMSEEIQEDAKHFLQTLKGVDISGSNNEKLLHYKIMNFQPKYQEIKAYVFRMFKINKEQKIFLNKKTSNKILNELISQYSSLENVQKYNLFTLIDEVIVLEWLKTLDPTMIEVASLIELPIAESVNVILDNLSEIKKYARFGIRTKIEY